MLFGNVVNQTCLLACHTIERAAHAYALRCKAANNRPNYARTAFGIQQCLHAVPAADAALSREQMRQNLCQPARMKLLAAQSAALRNRDNAFSSANNIIRTNLVLRIFQNRIADIIVVRQNSCRYRNYLILFHTLTSPSQPYLPHKPCKFYHTI